MKVLKVCLFLSGIFILGYNSISQEVKNIHFEQEDNKIIIFYDLLGGDNELYKIDIYCSEDDGLTWNQALIQVEGDVGENTKTGTNKKIVWDVLQEKENISGEISFKVTAKSLANSGIFTDNRDGQDYKWVEIGELIWMAENLNFRSQGGSTCYKNDSKNCKIFGKLYKWETAVDVCPTGWHLPAEDEWNELVNYLGGRKVAGGKMKESDTDHWNDSNVNPDYSVGFNCLPAGQRDGGGKFLGIGKYTFYWTSNDSFEKTDWGGWTIDKDSKAGYRHLLRKSKKVEEGHLSTLRSFSVRCVKDSY